MLARELSERALSTVSHVVDSSREAKVDGEKRDKVG